MVLSRDEVKTRQSNDNSSCPVYNINEPDQGFQSPFVISSFVTLQEQP